MYVMERRMHVRMHGRFGWDHLPLACNRRSTCLSVRFISFSRTLIVALAKERNNAVVPNVDIG